MGACSLKDSQQIKKGKNPLDKTATQEGRQRRDGSGIQAAAGRPGFITGCALAAGLVRSMFPRASPLKRAHRPSRQEPQGSEGYGSPADALAPSALAQNSSNVFYLGSVFS